jgi:cytochrome c-type biogenesis protein CcsB
VSPAELASFSDSAIAFASVVYALALLSHIAEWAFGRSVPGDVSTSEVLAAAGREEPAVVGAASGGVGSGTVAADAAPSYAGADGNADGGIRGLSDEHVAKARQVEVFGRIGVALTIVAAALHLAGLVTRGLSADRVPWGNMYEFAIAGAFGVTAIYLLLLRKYSLRWLGVFVTGFALIVLMLAVLLLWVPAGPLVPALQSYWLVIHVVAAVIAAGAFSVGAMASVFYLIKVRLEARPGGGPTTGYLARLPKASVLDRIAYRVHAFGFPVWTFAALIAGPIWAEYAWGRYWGWDPKEVWAFITWVVYAAYLHARATAGWRGKGAAIIALIGFATFLFNFVGINLFGSGLHSYSGLG